MAGVFGRIVTPVVASGTALQTGIQLLAASNHRVIVHEWWVGGQGVSNTDAPLEIKVVRQSTAGAGGTSLTPIKLNEGDNETLQVTALHTITTEPTTGDIVDADHVHPQGGIRWQAKFKVEIVVIGGNRLGISALAGVGIDLFFGFAFEE